MKQKMKILVIGVAFILVSVSLFPPVNADELDDFMEDIEDFQLAYEDEIEYLHELFDDPTEDPEMDDVETVQILDELTVEYREYFEEYEAYLAEQAPPQTWEGINSYWISDGTEEFPNGWDYFGHCGSLNKDWTWALITGVLIFDWTVAAIFFFIILCLPIIGIFIARKICNWIQDNWEYFVDFIEDLYENYQYGLVIFLFDPVQSIFYNRVHLFPGLSYEWDPQDYWNPMDPEYQFDWIQLWPV
jgi:hypothetical protein